MMAASHGRCSLEVDRIGAARRSLEVDRIGAAARLDIVSLLCLSLSQVEDG
jgi:hypothetical protein